VVDGAGADATGVGGLACDTPVTDKGSATAASMARIFGRRRMIDLPDRMGLTAPTVTQTTGPFTLGREKADVNG
jgi:hypothetical protein